MLGLLLVAVVTTAFASPLGPRSSADTPPILKVSDSQWKTLNTSVGGRLHLGIPFARPCFLQAESNVAGSYDPQACSAVQGGYKNDSVIVSSFGGYMNENWGTCQASGAKCELDYNFPYNPLATLAKCAQGSISTYYIDVKLPEDVAAAFAFAKLYSVPLAIKNSGHDYKGRSSAPLSLGIWTHNLQGITRNQKFVPSSCPSATTYDAVIFQAGTGFLQLYEFAEANGITVIGGSSETVGASGGWISGGGHSSLSNTLGLGADRALQFKIVTPDGKYLTASACENQDLFFAIRGGGGSTFGVIMESVQAAAPVVKLQVAYMKFISYTDQGANANFLKLLISLAPTFAAQGWGGYIEVGAITTKSSGFVLFTPSLTNAQAVAAMKPITEFISSNGNVAIQSTVKESPTFLSAYNEYLVPNEELVGVGVAVSSRLIPRESFAPGTNATALLNAILAGQAIVGTNVFTPDSGTLAYGGAPLQILVTTPINFTPGPTGDYPHQPLSAVTPVWRNSIWHVLFMEAFNNDAPDVGKIFKNVNTAANFLRAITPPGAYQNEADVFEPNHTESFWGKANYDRLLSIKKLVDPSSVLDCWQCINWTGAKSPRYACYPPDPTPGGTQ